MGVNGYRSSGRSSYYPEPSVNPDPARFTILDFEGGVNKCVLKVQYPGCTNYEGVKILVFHAGVKAVLLQKTLDPHFSDKKDKLYPVARFAPTAEGWTDALKYIGMGPCGGR